MRKYLLFLLCLFALSVTAFAVDVTQYTDDDWKALYGVPEPLGVDFEDSSAYLAAWDEWYEGYSAFVVSVIDSYRAYQLQEADRIAAEETAQQEEKNTPAPVETAPIKPIESTGSSDGNSKPNLADDSDDKYPLGSYVDTAGVVWSPDGVRLSPVTASDAVLVENSVQGVAPPSEAAHDPVYLSAAEDPDTLAVIASMVSDIAEDEPVWYLEDFRSTEAPVEIMDGLKSLVTSIFGEYTPVTTTSVVTETVGNETRQYLVEIVASGAAGVDYEWLAGVFLFGILLFCFMKLLGGVLK